MERFHEEHRFRAVSGNFKAVCFLPTRLSDLSGLFLLGWRAGWLRSRRKNEDAKIDANRRNREMM